MPRASSGRLMILIWTYFETMAAAREKVFLIMTGPLCGGAWRRGRYTNTKSFCSDPQEASR